MTVAAPRFSVDTSTLITYSADIPEADKGLWEQLLQYVLMLPEGAWTCDRFVPWGNGRKPGWCMRCGKHMNAHPETPDA